MLSYILPITPITFVLHDLRTSSWWEFSGAINAEEEVEERLLRMPVCLLLASLQQRSYAKSITFPL